MALVRSWTSSTSPKATGRPRTNRAPMIGPATDPMPPITAVAIMRSEPSVVKVAAGFSSTRRVMNRAPAKAAMPPERAKATSFMRVDEMVEAAAMSSFSLTAIIERPRPVRRTRAMTAVIRPRQARQRK